MANDDGIWIGGRPTTDEERQQLESEWQTGISTGEPEQPQQDAGGNDYYSGSGSSGSSNNSNGLYWNPNTSWSI